MTGNWIAVAAAAHVRRGRRAGFTQVCHGKTPPLGRIRPGDRVAYYSPVTEFRGKEKLRAFTTIGVVMPGEPYQADMGGGFRPFRRDVRWLRAKQAPIQPLLGALEFAAGKRNWGYQMRFGLFPIGERDMRTIAAAMEAELT